MTADHQDGYGTSPTKRYRRTQAEIDAIRDAICNVLAEDHPQTVRGCFYRVVSAGVVPKTESEYKQTVCRLLLELRRSGRVPYSWIIDGTRWMRKPDSWSGLNELLWEVASTYRRQLWSDQHCYLEVWSEKEAIAGVLHEVTAEWDVPLMVARGFASETFLYAAAQTIKSTRKPTYIYHFGDHDPSGVAAATAIERRLREFAPAAEIHFERAAVTERQVEELELPTRPTKRTDTRAKHWQGNSVEVDAIPSRMLRDLVEDCITRHVDGHALVATREVEAQERDLLYAMHEGYTQ